MQSIPAYKFKIFKGLGFNKKSKNTKPLVGYILTEMKTGTELCAGLTPDTKQSDFEVICWAYGDIANKTGIIFERPKLNERIDCVYESTV